MRIRGVGLSVLSVLIAILQSRALAGNEITYQGCLEVGGEKVSGTYGLRFTLYDGPTTDAMQVGSPCLVCDVSVIVCQFTVVLNQSGEFGPDVVSDKQLWLSIEVDEGGCDDFVRLRDRQRLTPPPWSKGANTVKTAANIMADFPAVDVGMLWEGARPARFAILNPANFNAALQADTSGGGSAINATASGSGFAVLATASGTGRAGLFQITNAGNSADSLQATTAGSGRGIRAFSALGVGLLAESGSGVGLRASSTSGTALDVVGPAAFSGTASFNGNIPFVVANPAVIPNLNASFLAGNNAAFYQNASNLVAGVLPAGRLTGTYSLPVAFSNASNTFAGSGAALTDIAAANISGTLDDARLSSNVALLGTAQTFTAPKTFAAATFTGLATFNARVVASSGAPQPTLRSTSTGSGRAGEFEGNVHVTGDLTRAFAAGTASMASPIAYGTINADGSIASSTPNITSSWDGARYLITITGQTYTIGGYSTIVTPVVAGAGAPVMASTSVAAGQLVVRMHNLQGVVQQQQFQFVTFRP